MALTREQKQAEKDLLATARELLERHATSLRYGHLYPKGPNDALLLESYQELTRLHTVGRLRWRSQRHKLRLLKRLLRKKMRRDALDRTRRLTFGYPPPRPQRVMGEASPIVWKALDDLSVDARDAVEEVYAHIQGQSYEELEAAHSYFGGRSRVMPRFARGLDIFREKLVNRALEDPEEIPRLHPQHISFARSPLPTTRRHPIARLLLVKLPLYFWMTFILIFNTAYLGAYMFFNDEVFGRFLGGAISTLIDGEIEFGSIHWTPSLLVKLVTGQPAHLRATDVKVWGAYKTTDHGKELLTAHAEEVELDMILHEIIPWNRAGIPEVLEIPWRLHFTSIKSEKPVWVLVKQYQDTTTEGEDVWRISLVDAFKPAPREWPTLTTRRISFQMDELTLPIDLDLDMTAQSNWRLQLALDRVTFDLDFLGLHPLEPVPVEKPLRFRVSGHATEGQVAILSLGEHGYFIPLEDFDVDDFTDGMDGAPLGDIRIRGAALFAGSPGSLDGWLMNMFHEDKAVDTTLSLLDAGPLARTILAAHGMPEKFVTAEGAPAELSFAGLFTDPTISLAASGLVLDFFDDPELDWTVRDAAIGVALHKERLPTRWDDHVLSADTAWIADIQQFEGDALGGHTRIHPFGDRNHIVVSTGQPGPLMMSFDVDLFDVNPAELTANDALIQRLSGTVNGRLQVPKLVLATGAQTRLTHVELGLEPLVLERLHGPRDDGIPRSLTARGGVVLDEQRGLDLDELVVTTTGATVKVTGGIDPEWSTLRPTDLDVKVSDGRAFWSAYGQDPYFDRLSTHLQLSGPLTGPEGRNGTLSVSGVGAGDYALTGVEDARLWMDRGVLKLRSPTVKMLGGRGPLAADLWLFERGEVSSDPRLMLKLDLEDAEYSDILGDAVSGKGEIHVLLADEEEKAVPLSRFQVRGEVAAPALKIGVTPFRDVAASFDITREGLEIKELGLAYHRAVSPYHAPKVSVRVGSIQGKGSLSFDPDPELALQLQAGGLPVSALVGMAGVESLPIAGQVRAGTELEIGGSLSAPSVHGNINLTAMSGAGIPLGDGKLVLHSEDCEAGQACPGDTETSGEALLRASGLAARREVRVRGSFGGKKRSADDPQRLSWTVDAALAIGTLPKAKGKQRRGSRATPPISTEFTASFEHLPVANLLRSSDPRLREHLVGQFQDLAISARLCDPKAKLLATCTDEEMSVSEWGLNPRLNLSLGRLWLRAADTLPKSGRIADPCEHPSALCSDPDTPLVAELEGLRLKIREPWHLQTWDRDRPAQRAGGQGRDRDPEANDDKTLLERAAPRTGRDGRRQRQGQGQGQGRPGRGTRELKLRALTVSGDIDLSPASPTDVALPGDEDAPRARCVPPKRASADPLSDAVVTITGELALGGISGIAEAYGLERLRGRVGVHALELKGPISAPVITGSVDIPADNPPVRIDLGGASPISFRVPALNVRVVDNTVYVAGKAAIGGQIVEFGNLGGKPTYITITGECAGDYSVSAQGELDGELVRAQVPSVFKQASGSLELRDFHLAGDARADPPIRTLHGVVESGHEAFSAEFAFPGLEPIELRRGPVELVRCSNETPCPYGLDGYGVFVGGVNAARAAAAPSSALKVKFGTRGRATLWGYVVLPPDFSAISASDLRLQFSNIRYTSFDNSGRPELKTVVSSDGISLSGRDLLTLHGDVEVVSAKWIRDAQEQFKVLSFEDPTPAPESPPPELLEDLQLDLKVNTGAPARVDNNVFKGVEGHLQLAVTGTYSDIDLAGKIDVTTGVLDISILGVPYDIQRGKVVLKSDLGESIVDILAMRQEPIYIDRQPRQMYLELAGTLDTIEWRCIVQGDSSGALSSYECAQYLVLGEGEQDAVETDVRRYGGGGLLGKPITLVGNLTKLKLNTYIERSRPNVAPYVPEVSLRLGQSGIEIDAETPPRWFHSDWGSFSLGGGYTRGYPGLLLRQSGNWRVRFRLLDNATLEFRDSLRSYYNERIIFDPLRQRKLELKFDVQLPSVR